jgi:hypothetical protein
MDWTGVLWCFHKAYRLGDKHDLQRSDFSSWDEMEEHLRTALGAVAILPVYLMDHGGVSMRTTSFNDRWDSGQVGFIWASKESIQKMCGDESPDPKELNEVLQHEVAVYDSYLRGDVWGYIIYRGNMRLQSCAGFYSREDAENEAEAEMKALEEGEGE